MSNVRKSTNRDDAAARISRSSIAKTLSRYQMMIADMNRYSGPEPQILPFPPELIMRILGYLDSARDKRNARLVCKGFAEAGLSCLTSTAYFSTSLIGIDYASEIPYVSSPTLEIANHPVVSKYITKLVCEGTQLSTNYLTLSKFRSWWAFLDKPRTLWPVEMVHNLYSSRYAQEDWINRNGEDQKIFYKVLEKFPKLDCVIFRDVTLNSAKDWPRPTWPSDVPQGDLWGPSSPYHSFAMCIRSLSEMNTKLRELHIAGTNNAISHRIFIGLSPQDDSHLLNVFANLVKVSVNINTHRDLYPLAFTGLGRVLTHATKLESLDLKCHASIARRSLLIPSQVFRDFTWPHLKHLGLSGFKLWTAEGLIAFLYRHRATIDSVSLRFIFLHHKDSNSPDEGPCEAWKHFFDELRRLSVTFQDLHLFRIHDCRNSERGDTLLHFRAARGEKVLRYLRYGGPNPLRSNPFEPVAINNDFH